MDFKIGQEYKQKNGKVVTLLATNAKGHKPLVVQGPGDHDVSLRYPDGSSMGPGLNAPDDLVGEYVPLFECTLLINKRAGTLYDIKPAGFSGTDEEWAESVFHDQAWSMVYRIAHMREIEP